MSDEELDREWKPSNRPQSTMARSFSLALNDLFKIDNSIADLDAAVSEKKAKVSSQTSELEALEARLKATEERLKAAASRSPPNQKSGRSSPRPRAPLGSDTFSEHTTSPLASEFNRPPSNRSGHSTRSGTNKSTEGRPATGKSASERPNSAWRQGSRDAGIPQALLPGAAPPTPGTSEDGGDSAEDAPPPPPKDSAKFDD